MSCHLEKPKRIVPDNAMKRKVWIHHKILQRRKDRRKTKDQDAIIYKEASEKK